MSLPIIDIRPLYTQDAKAKQRVAEAIDHACRKEGFFYIVGHPISDHRIAELRYAAKCFFALSPKEKERIDITQSKHHRGYGKLAAEQLDPQHPADQKETFDMALNLPLSHPRVGSERPLYGPNLYPDLPGWRTLMEQHYQDMLKLGLCLLRALALALKLDEDFFDDKFTYPISVLRLLHYPAQSDALEREPVAAAHSDYGCLTLLWQDEVGGLQVQGEQGGWIDAPPVPGSFVVNIGQMMARWSNDRYRATQHRVLSPQGQERFSIPFFLEPDFDTLIECLPNCQSPEHPPHYAPVRAGDWLLDCFARTYRYRQDTLTHDSSQLPT